MDAISLIILNCAKTSDINLALVFDLMHEIKCLDNFFLSFKPVLLCLSEITSKHVTSTVGNDEEDK